MTASTKSTQSRGASVYENSIAILSLLGISAYLVMKYGFTLPNNPYSILRVKINNKIYEINSNLIINMNEIIDELDESYPTDTVGTIDTININKEDNFKNKIKYLYDHHIN